MTITSIGQSNNVRGETLLSKQGLAIMRVAQGLMKLSPGERVEPVQEQAARHGMSVGTIQAALDYLHNTGAVQIEARGRLGSFAGQLHYPQLWAIAERRAMVGSLPLPYTRRIEGLATGIREQYNQHSIDLSLRFMRGSTQRLQALTTSATDWAIVSVFAATTAASHGFTIDLVAQLGPNSYMQGHGIVSRCSDRIGINDLALQPGLRFGIDIRSTDHAYSVRTVTRGQAVQLVPIEYHQGLQLLQDRLIDATIWSYAESQTLLSDFHVAPLEHAQAAALSSLTEAAIIVSHGNLQCSNLLQHTLSQQQLRETQQAVVVGQRMAEW